MQVFPSAAVIDDDGTGQSPTTSTALVAGAQRPPGRISLSPAAAILLAISLGLCMAFSTSESRCSASTAGTRTDTFETPQTSHGPSRPATRLCYSSPGSCSPPSPVIHGGACRCARGLAACVAGDLGGFAQVAAVWRVQLVAGGRAGAGDRRRGRGPRPRARGGLRYVASRRSWGCWLRARLSRRVGRLSVSIARSPPCRGLRRRPKRRVDRLGHRPSL